MGVAYLRLCYNLGLCAAHLAIELLILPFLFGGSYPFNNMLHHHVESIVSSCLESNSQMLIDHLFQECLFLNKLLAADENPYAPDSQSEVSCDSLYLLLNSWWKVNMERYFSKSHLKCFFSGNLWIVDLDPFFIWLNFNTFFNVSQNQQSASFLQE